MFDWNKDGLPIKHKVKDNQNEESFMFDWNKDGLPIKHKVKDNQNEEPQMVDWSQNGLPIENNGQNVKNDKNEEPTMVDWSQNGLPIEINGQNVKNDKKREPFMFDWNGPGLPINHKVKDNKNEEPKMVDWSKDGLPIIDDGEKFRINDYVRISGIKNQPILNKAKGTVKAKPEVYDSEEDRLLVKIDDYDVAKYGLKQEYSIRHKNLALDNGEFQIGEKVKIQNKRLASDYNEKIATIIDKERNGTIWVKVNGKEGRIKAAHLKKVERNLRL